MKKIKNILIIILLILTVFLSGCITINNPFENTENNDNTNPETIIPEETELPEENKELQTGIITSNEADACNWYWIYGTSSGYIAQTFLTPQSFAITAVEIQLDITDTIENEIVVQIQQVSNDKPNTKVITSGFLDKNSINDGWNKINLVNAQLQGNTQYAIVIGSPGTNPGPIRIMSNRPEKYTGGEAFYGNDFNDNSWYPRVNEDFLFKIWGKW